MRLKTLLSFVLASLLATPLITTHAFAQDDEFGDFDDDFGEAPADDSGGDSGDAGGGDAGDAAGADDEFGDLEDDAFTQEPGEGDASGDSASDTGDDEFGGLDDETPSAADDTPTETDTEAAQAYRERRHQLHNTWGGSVGGIHVVDAGSGAAGAFRAQLGIDFFLVNGWLSLGTSASEEHSHIGGSLSLSWNPWDFLEIYASIASWANSNEQENPALFQVLGDTLLGVKAYYHVEGAPFLFVGGDIGIGLLNTVGDIGLVGESTSAGIRVNATADLRELEDRIPFIARLNLQYWFDNSSVLVNAVERARYNGLPTSGPDARASCPEDSAAGDCLEDRHLITRVERYSLQIDRVDHFRIAIGLEAPLTVMEGFTISPIAEWKLDVPVNRQGFSCLDTAGLDGVIPDGEDGCLLGTRPRDLPSEAERHYDRADAFEQTLTLGVRVLPPLRGMSIFVAADIGLTGTNRFVRELSGQEPYNIRLGFGWAFDTIPQVRIEEREVRVEIPGEEVVRAPVMGHIAGTIIEQGTETTIAGAIVAFPGREFTSLSSTAGGTFTTHDVAPGEEVSMTISHPEYHEGSCSGTIPEEGGEVQVRCELEALPRLGSVRGRVTGDDGSPVGGATVNIMGQENRSLTTAPDGTFSSADLQPGTYVARVEAEAYLIKVETFEIAAREESEPQIVLISRPRRRLVRVTRRQITIRRQVNFATNSADILPNSTELLSEIADVMMRNPHLTRIEIQGHTDNRGGRQHNQDLSQRRAEAVRDWLVRAGVEAGRLEARGYGQDDPRVPNITASNRARNRRVQFMITEQVEPAE